MAKVLVIDDDRSVLRLVQKFFEQAEITVLSATNSEEGLDFVTKEQPDVVLLDIMLLEGSGLDVFRRIHEVNPRLPVIFITASGASNTAIEAMKVGAYDYVVKPLDAALVRELVQQAIDLRRLHVPVQLPDKGADQNDGDLLVGQSPQMLAVYKAIGRVAPQDVTVLIRGESGTGKELIARAIFQHSRRAAGPFLAVNCAAITDNLLESELFGHEKGSFTSADRRRIGKFEQCSGGTIFLDEVGDMSPLVQSKVLRVLQEQQFERVGGNEMIQTDVRIIAATNRDFERMVADGTFRSDLYYRLNGFTIKLPPLRERGEDINLLLERFLVQFNRQLGREVQGISAEALKLLVEYPWPGNIRELQSLLKKAILQTNGPVLAPEFLPEEILLSPQGQVTPDDDGMPVSDIRSFMDERLLKNSTNVHAEATEMLERYLVTRVLRLTHGNQSKGATILGITRGSLRHKMRALGISIDPNISVEEQEDMHG